MHKILFEMEWYERRMDNSELNGTQNEKEAKARVHESCMIHSLTRQNCHTIAKTIISLKYPMQMHHILL